MTNPKYRYGDKVCVKAGFYRGYMGICTDSYYPDDQRYMVSLDLTDNIKKTVLLSEDEIEPVAASFDPQGV